MRRASLIAVVLAIGCTPSLPTSVVTTTSAQLPGAGLHVAPNIASLCKIERATPERDVLGQIARCMMTGPLKEKKIALLGRADPRIDEELGSFRVAKVRDTLIELGVPAHDVIPTSRQSPDESDSRVDLILAY